MAEEKTIQVIWLVISLFVFQTSIYSEDALVKLYSEARAAEKAGNYAVAVDKYERIVKLAPDMAEAHAKLGGMYYSIGERGKAEIAFKDAIRLNPKLWGPRLALGVMAFDAHNYDLALKNLKEAELLDPSNIPIQLYLGYTQYARSHFLEAAGHFERAAQNDHPDEDAIYHLSKAYAQVARDFFELLQGRFEDSAYAHLAKAHSYELKNDWEHSELEYRNALERLPDNVRLQQKSEYISLKATGKGGTLVKDNPSDDLIDGFLKLQVAAPTGPDIIKELHRYQAQVETLRRIPDHTKSARDCYLLEEGYQSLSFLASLWVFDLQPDSFRSHQLRGQYYEARQQDQEAITEYRRALELNPKLRKVHLSIGTIYWTKGNLKEALPEIQQEIELDPNNSMALYIAGDILYSQNQMNGAKEYYLKSLALAPNMIEAHLGVARIYTSEGDYENVVNHLQQVLKLEPQNTMAHYQLAHAYQKLGKLEDSKRELQIFERLKIEHPRKY